jgi:hypothetical protein
MFKKLLHGIDMSAPGAVEELIEFHRLTFGDAVMEDPPGTPPAGNPAGDPPAGDPPAGDPPASDPPAGDPPADPPGTEALGDPGKRALDAMKARAAEEKRKRLAAEARIAELTAPKPGDELTPEQLREQIRTEERKALRAPLLKAEVRGLAATLEFNDPNDAHLYLNLDEFEPAPDGGFDTDEISEKLTELLGKKPWLKKTPAGQSGTGPAPRVPAPPAHGNPPTPPTLDEQIATATAAGDFSKVLRLQNQKLANYEPK